MIVPFARNETKIRPIRRFGLPVPALAPSEPIPLVGNTDPWAWLLASSLRIDLWKLARFGELMALEGMPIQLGRMFREPAYAFERLSQAHSTGVIALKALALEIFEQYAQLQRRRGGTAGAYSVAH